MYVGFWWGNLKTRPLGKPKRRWEGNIKRDRREIGWEGMEWIRLSQDRDKWWAFVNRVKNCEVSQMRGVFS
jgi:hypothetical protein